MQGTILIIDAVPTNRIMLKVQLSSAFYHVVQADGMKGLLPLVRRCRPDLVLCAMTLPDGGAIAVRNALARDAALADIPIIAMTARNDRQARIAALRAGIDDVLSHPLNDTLLQARIRSLFRAHGTFSDLQQQGGPTPLTGLCEQRAAFQAISPRARIAVVSRRSDAADLWRTRLERQVAHPVAFFTFAGVNALMKQPIPDAIVLELAGEADSAGFDLLADLRARHATRNSVVLGVLAHDTPALAARALDLGAHDVLHDGFCATELALRIERELQRRTRCARLRDTLRDGMRASLLDPMTGLHNRRFALPRLSEMLHQAAETRRRCAVMLADLDHFKRVNDSYGHPVGDAVLVETARRLRCQTRPGDLVARIGGEEFLIATPDVTQGQALDRANAMRRAINETPFLVAGLAQPIRVTTSIGIVLTPTRRDDPGTTDTGVLIRRADRALYAAKNAGRNQVTLARVAA